MADLQLDTTGDLLVQDDELKLVIDDDAIVQHTSIRLRFFQGEFFLDTRLGVPYFDQILIKNPDLVAIRGILREAILETPGIQALDAFTTDFDAATRKLTVTFTARKTSNGELLDFTQEFLIG